MVRITLPSIFLGALAEESLLMQFEKSSGLNVDHGAMNSMQQGAQGVMDAYQNLLQKIVASGSIEDKVTGERYVPASGILDTVRSQFSNLEVDLVAQKNANNDILTSHFNAVAQCNTDRRNAFAGAGGVVKLKEAMQSARTTHSDCRGVENTNILAMEASCKAFQDSDRCKTNPDDYDQDWFASSSNDQSGKSHHSLQEIISKAETCRADVGTVNAKALECDGAQDSFNGAFCAYESKLTETCNTHASCYASAVAHNNLANQSISKLEEEQMTMWRMVQRVHCYLDLLFNTVKEESPAMPTQPGIDACNAITTDVTQASADGNIGITYHTVDDADACLDNEENADDGYTLASPTYRPGEQSWRDAEILIWDKHGETEVPDAC